jgi:hypothetical protein
VLCALAVFAAACGDDDSSSNGGSDGPSAPSGGVTDGRTAGITDDTIRFGAIAAIEPPGGQEPIPGIDAGLRARFDRANRDGELSRQIEFVGTEDDQGDEGLNLEVARSLVLRDEVFAISNTSQGAGGSSAFLNDEHVPYIGWGFTPNYCGDVQYGFGFSGCLSNDVTQVSTGVTAILLDHLESEGLSRDEARVAMINEDYGGGRAGLSQVYSATTGQGVEVVYAEAALPPEAQGVVSDYTPYVTAMLEAEPNVIFIASGFSNAIGLTAALKAAGFEGTIANAIAYVPGLLEAAPDIAAALDGSYVVIVGFGASEFGGEHWDIAREDCEQSSDECFLSLGFIVGYSTADFFIQVSQELERREAEDGWEFNAENFAAILGDGFDLPGLGNIYGATSWPDDRRQNGLCSAMVRINGTEYEAVTDLDCSFEYVPFDLLS